MQKAVSELFQAIDEGRPIDFDEFPVDEANILEDIVADCVLQ